MYNGPSIRAWPGIGEGVGDVGGLDVRAERHAGAGGLLGGPPRVPAAAGADPVARGGDAGVGLGDGRAWRSSGRWGCCRGPLLRLGRGRDLVVGLVLRRLDARTATERRPRTRRRWGWEAVAALGAGPLGGGPTSGWCVALVAVKVVSDGPIYHLYFAARWWKAGRLFLVATPFGENAATYFPAVGDLWFTWLMVGWGGDRLARVGQVPFLSLAALAAFATGPTARGGPRRRR